VDPAEPGRQRLVGQPRSDLAGPADQFLHREGARPDLGVMHHRLPDVLSGQAKDQAGAGQVSGREEVTDMTGQIDAELDHDAGDLG